MVLFILQALCICWNISRSTSWFQLIFLKAFLFRFPRDSSMCLFVLLRCAGGWGFPTGVARRSIFIFFFFFFFPPKPHQMSSHHASVLYSCYAQSLHAHAHQHIPGGGAHRHTWERPPSPGFSLWKQLVVVQTAAIVGESVV